MSFSLLGGLVPSLVAISALLIFSLRSDGTRLAVRLRLRHGGVGQDRRGTAVTLFVAAAGFLLIAGIGAATSYWGEAPEAISSGARSGSDSETLARLRTYTRSIRSEKPATTAEAGKLLPDVNAMIDRLAARLKTTPDDIEGWRTLGWSYFNTARYEQAATAYARAIELDPNSAELKLSYEEAKAKASETDSSETALSLQTATPPHEQDAVVRPMVDRLADRLESSPRDVDGWTLLMRSRVMRGEREIAAIAFRKALEVFKDDSAASDKIAAVAIELGLKARQSED